MDRCGATNEVEVEEEGREGGRFRSGRRRCCPWMDVCECVLYICRKSS